ncbi:hypothetical protein [Mycoplasma sp. P36-A1]|uniref:hypothetical protein n=1 Tax=Mycoplasma sp. P36-A1 TaxID=3252900 RepID=UPI003C2E603D
MFLEKYDKQIEIMFSICVGLFIVMEGSSFVYNYILDKSFTSEIAFAIIYVIITTKVYKFQKDI